MTAVRVRRLTRTVLLLWGTVALTFGIVFLAGGHAEGVIALGVWALAWAAAFIVSPPARPERPRQLRQAPPRKHPDLGEYPVQVAEFMAQVSAWEAERRQKS